MGKTQSRIRCVQLAWHAFTRLPRAHGSAPPWTPSTRVCHHDRGQRSSSPGAARLPGSGGAQRRTVRALGPENVPATVRAGAGMSCGRRKGDQPQDSAASAYADRGWRKKQTQNGEALPSARRIHAVFARTAKMINFGHRLVLDSGLVASVPTAWSKFTWRLTATASWITPIEMQSKLCYSVPYRYILGTSRIENLRALRRFA